MQRLKELTMQENNIGIVVNTKSLKKSKNMKIEAMFSIITFNEVCV